MSYELMKKNTWLFLLSYLDLLNFLQLRSSGVHIMLAHTPMHTRHATQMQICMVEAVHFEFGRCQHCGIPLKYQGMDLEPDKGGSNTRESRTTIGMSLRF